MTDYMFITDMWISFDIGEFYLDIDWCNSTWYKDLIRELIIPLILISYNVA